MRLLAALLWIFGTIAPAWAATLVSVQSPAWVERDAQRQPLAAGMTVRNGDILLTGKNGRLRLQFEEGSQVKLGEDARFVVRETRFADGLLTSTLEAARGAFRFTTTALGAAARRDVSIRVGAATMGVRGTDVWGKSADEKDIICLIEGRVTVESEGQSLVLGEPLAFFVKPQGKPALPVGRVDPKQLEEWGKQTEPLPEGGQSSVGGEWRVNLYTSEDPREVATRKTLLETEGYPVETVEISDLGLAVTRLCISNLGSRKDAEALARRLQGRYGIGMPWVTR